MKLMVQGTMSSSGKSFLTAALLRIFSNKGYSVAPFKSQNMSSNYIMDDNLKISNSQAIQSIFARKKLDPRFNPILLEPTSSTSSTINILGEKYKDMEGNDYFDIRDRYKNLIMDTYNQLEKENDIVIIEGAGSPVEINLYENDIVNMGLADMVDSPVILVADIDRGGVFASIYGTIMLLEKEHRKRVKGIIINKFKGDISLLEPGLRTIEEIIRKPILGVIPFIDNINMDYNIMVDKRNSDKLIEKISKIVLENLNLKKIEEIIYGKYD